MIGHLWSHINFCNLRLRHFVPKELRAEHNSPTCMCYFWTECKRLQYLDLHTEACTQPQRHAGLYLRLGISSSPLASRFDSSEWLAFVCCCWFFHREGRKLENFQQLFPTWDHPSTCNKGERIDKWIMKSMIINNKLIEGLVGNT